jgi:trigger factor
VEVTINEVNDYEREMDVTMSVEELAPHFEKAYKEAIPHLEIKGFRKGKVPMPMVKKMFGSSIEYQAVEDITNDVFRKEIETRNISPLGSPTINKIDFKPGTPLTFKVKYEVKPEFELKDLSTISIEKFVHKTNDTEIQNELDRLQQINATYEEAQKVDGENFVVTVDMVDFDEQGNAVPSSKREAMKISLKEKSTEKEIKDALVEAAIGDVKEAKFEHQHGDHSHKVHIQMTVQKIEKMNLPPLDDALAKKVSDDKFQTVEELKQSITKDLAEFWEDRGKRKFETDLLDAIVKQYEIGVPEALVQNIIDTYIEDAKGQQPNRQLPKNFNEKQYREASRETAQWQAKWLLIKEKMIETEKIEIPDSDIEKIAEEESKKLNIDKERLVNFYKTSDNALERLKYDRLMSGIKQKISVKEIETDDYSKFALH